MRMSCESERVFTKCKKREAAHFCHTCGFVCQRCEETHQEGGDLASHEIIRLDEQTGDLITPVIPPLKKPRLCSKHLEKEADLHFEEETSCECVARHHQADLVSTSSTTLQERIPAFLNPVEKTLATLGGALEGLDTQQDIVLQQEISVVAEIDNAITRLQQALEERKTELVGEVEQATQQKLNSLAAQRGQLELREAQLRSCHDSVQENLCTGNQGGNVELSWQNLLVRRLDQLMGSIKPELLVPLDQLNIKFTHCQHELAKTCQHFGVSVTILPDLDTSPIKICYSKAISCLNQPRGIAVMEGGEVVITERCGDCFSIISASLEEKSSFGTRGSAPGQFSQPEGVAIDARGNIVVCDYGNHRIQQFSASGKHLKAVGTEGNGPLQFRFPKGIAVHPLTHKIYVTDTGNHRIQVLNSDLTYHSSFGSEGTNNGEFLWLCDVATAPCTESNDLQGACVRVIASSLQSVEDASELPLPRVLRGRVVRAIESYSVYAADRYNSRIQVFSPDGQYVREFGRKGEGEEELNHPISIAIDPHNLVYVGEDGNECTCTSCVSVFTTSGQFIHTSCCLCPYSLFVSVTGTLYVSV